MSTLNMKTYAYVHLDSVWEVILPRLDEAGEAIEINKLYAPEFLANCIDVTSLDPQPEQGWTAKQDNGEWVFSPLVIEG